MRSLSRRFTPHLEPLGAPNPWPPEGARLATAQSPGQGGRLRTSVLDPRARGY